MSINELMNLVNSKINAKLAYPFNGGKMNSNVIYHVYQNKSNNRTIAIVYERDSRLYLNLKLTPQHVAEVVEIDGILPGFHMNKKHWITIDVNNTDVSCSELIKMLQESERLISKF